MTTRVTAAVALLATPIAIVSGCAKQSANNAATPTTSTTTGSASSAQQLTTQLNAPDGKHVADATVDFSNGYATVTIQTVATGLLSPGFHALHIHAVGKCEANSVAPTGGQSGDFASAGEHFQAPGHTGQPASGDLPPLLVRSDGSGKLVATSDAFTQDQLKGPEGSSIVLHQGANSPDVGTQATTDKRVACGVLSPASTTTTSVSTSTSTVTTTAVAPVPPATVTSTPTTTTPTPTPSTSTSTSTVTVTSPTYPPTYYTPTPPPYFPGPNGG